MKKKVVVAITCAAAVSMLMATTVSADGRKFGYTCMDGTNPFFVALQGAIEEVVNEHGDELVAMDPANDSNTQVNQIEDLINTGIELMFVNPVDADGIIPALDMLKESDIPMFGFDTQVGDMSYLVSYAGSDNYNAGYVCGKDLAEKVPEGGDILILSCPTMQSITDRTDGFKAALEESGVTFNIVDEQDGQGNQQVSNEKATDMLTAHPDVVAFFGGNDPTALGIYAACDAADVSPLVYGVDGSPDVKALLKTTCLEGTGAQSPITIGKTIAETAYKWLDGEEVETEIPIDTFLVTADNVDDYGTDGWQ